MEVERIFKLNHARHIIYEFYFVSTLQSALTTIKGAYDQCGSPIAQLRA